MGFDIWASGVTGPKRKIFNYSKKDCLDQGDFEPPKILTMIPSSPNAAGVAKKIVGTPESHVGGATVKGMFIIAEMQFVHLVTTGVDLLAIHGRRGSISVYCQESKWYWADSNSFVNFHLNTNEPGKDFLKAISSGLVKNDLNNFGVLGQIAICLSEYNKVLPNSVAPNLRIELSH